MWAGEKLLMRERKAKVVINPWWLDAEGHYEAPPFVSLTLRG